MAEFLSGDLSSDEETVVGAHLQACESCNQVARVMSEAPLARAMLVAAHDVEQQPPVSLIELKARLRALASFGETTEEPSQRATSVTIASGDTKPNESLLASTTTVRRLGKFEILKELGAGGFGVVYLALDTVLQRHVALKLPRSCLLADPDARERFYREAQALARLDHPHVLPVYEAGESEGTCYLAVAYCEGPTLESWRKDQKRPVDPLTAARIVRDLATAVQHAHEHGILHRDIKPANVLLSVAPSGDRSQPVPRLADFGLAKIADQAAPGTLSGVVMGTPQYLAPEQAAGMTDHLGPWTDVYGLGAVLYELLTGCAPIRGASSVDTLRRILVDDPTPPSALDSAVPSDFDAVVMKCLAKPTTSRYATARELADELDRLLDGKAVNAIFPAACEPHGSWRSSRRLVAVSAVLLLSAFVAALAALIFKVSDQDRRLTSQSSQTAEGSDSTAASAQHLAVPAGAVVDDKPPENDDVSEPIHELDSLFALLPAAHGVVRHTLVSGTVGSVLSINALDAGWWGGAHNGHTATNKNFLVARNSHNFFVFDLGTVRHKIISADLRLAINANNGYNSGDPFENYALFDVSTPLAELQGSGTHRSDIFHDLASGTLFGKQKFVNSDEGKIKSVPLNADGIAALNAAAGELFALGGALTTTDGTGGALFARSGEFSCTKQLTLTLASPATKRYSLRLAGGEQLSAELRPQAGRATLEIQDPGGVTLARAIPGGNQNQRINHFTAPRAGSYVLVIQAIDHISYRLNVVCDGTLEGEPNDSRSTPQHIAVGNPTRDKPAISVIVPSHLATTEGNRGNGSPFNLEAHDLPSMRYQQIYAKSEFPRPGTITAIRFRRNRNEPSFSTAGLSLKINLGYAATELATLSSTFADNIGAATTTVLDADDLVLSSTANGSPHPFDVVIPLATPFSYDPAQGDLLMDVFMRNAATTVQFDFSCRGEQTTTRRVVSRHVNSTVGSVDFSSDPTFAGLITCFDMAQEDSPEATGPMNWSVLGAIASPPIVPSQVVNTSLDGANGYPFHLAKVGVASMRYQQFYSRREFNQPAIITALCFRRNLGEAPFTTPGIDLKINLGYAATSPTNPSLTFANNVGPESTTVLDTANLTLSSTSTAHPLPFDIVIPFQNAFNYDPNRGDLLMDISMRNAPTTARFSSAGRAQPLVMRRIYATDVNAEVGSTGSNFMGLLITRFDTVADEDWYSFDLTSAGERLRFEITALTGGAGQESSKLNPGMDLYDPSGALIFSEAESADGRCKFIDFGAHSSGTYQLRVTGRHETTGPYLLSCSSQAR